MNSLLCKTKIITCAALESLCTREIDLSLLANCTDVFSFCTHVKNSEHFSCKAQIKSATTTCNDRSTFSSLPPP